MTATNITWLPSSLLFDRHLIYTLRVEQSWKLQGMKERHVKRVLEKGDGDAQRLLYSYLELRTGGVPPYPPVLSGTAIKCLLSHGDVEDIYFETGCTGNVSDFASDICAAPPEEFISFFESLASAPFDETSPRARRITRRAMEILMYREYSWCRKRHTAPYPDVLTTPFSTLHLKKNVRQYARSHNHFSSPLNSGSVQYRSFTTDVFSYALNIGLNQAEALACTDEAVDHHRIVQFLSALPKRARKSPSTWTEDVASRDAEYARGRKRGIENTKLLQAAAKKRKLDSPARVGVEARMSPEAIISSQQQRIEPGTIPHIQASASIEANTKDTPHGSNPTKEDGALDASIEENRRLKDQKRRRKEEKMLRKEERRRHREERRQRKEERRQRREEKRQRKLAQPGARKTTAWTTVNLQPHNDPSRKDSYHESETLRSSTSSASISFVPELFDDDPSQQLWMETKGQLLQAMKAEMDSSWSEPASEGKPFALMQSALPSTACKKRKQTRTTSESKHKPAGVSAIRVPPLSAENFGLIQEELANEPFALLVAVKLLNKTRGHFPDHSHPLSALNTFTRLMERYPTPEALAIAEVEDMTATIRHLGLQNQRAKTLIAMAQTWVRAPPQKGVRYPTPGYPTHVQGAGKQIIDANSKSAYIDDESVDPRIDAFEIAHLPGIGPYALDSWRIFCRDVLRGLATSYNSDSQTGRGPPHGDGRFEPEWKRVRPADKDLRAFLKWLWLKEGWIWDPETGERYRASKQVMEEAECGNVWFEANQGKDETVTEEGTLTMTSARM